MKMKRMNILLLIMILDIDLCKCILKVNKKDYMEYEDWTVLKKAPDTFKDNSNDPLVNTCTKTVQDFRNLHSEHIYDIEKVQDLIDDIYKLDTKWLNPTFLWQILDLVLAKSKPIDMRLESNALTPQDNEMATKAFREIMKDSWFVEMLAWPKWWFFTKLAFWDFFFLMSANAVSWMPEFKELDTEQVFFDIYWTKLLTKSWKKITRCVIVTEYEWDNAISLFPWIEKVATIGKLPLTKDMINITITPEQESKQYRLVQVWTYFDISDVKNPKSVTIAWPWKSIIPWTLKEWKAYEQYFWKFNHSSYEPYLPIWQFACKPYWKWVFNKWLWQLFYKSSQLLADVRNKFIRVTSRNAEPTTLLNTPASKKNYLVRKLNEAENKRKDWKPPIIINEVWTGLEWWAEFTSLKTESVIAEYQQILEDIKQEAKNFWINIDIFASEASKSATAVVIEEQNLSLAIQQLHEVNAKTYEMVWRYIIDIYKKNIKPKDDTPFKFKPSFKEDWEVINLEKPITRWEIQELFNKYEFDVITDTKSWVYPTPLFEERIKTRFINNLLQVWEIEEAKRLIAESANSFWLNIQTTQPQPQPQWWQLEQPWNSPLQEIVPLLEWNNLTQ